MPERIKTKHKLKECPWCKQIPKLVKSDIYGYDGHYHYRVSCVNQFCNIQPHTIKVDDVYRSCEKAIDIVVEHWNDRK